MSPSVLHRNIFMDPCSVFALEDFLSNILTVLPNSEQERTDLYQLAVIFKLKNKETGTEMKGLFRKTSVFALDDTSCSWFKPGTQASSGLPHFSHILACAEWLRHSEGETCLSGRPIAPLKSQLALFRYWWWISNMRLLVMHRLQKTRWRRAEKFVALAQPPPPPRKVTKMDRVRL